MPDEALTACDGEEVTLEAAKFWLEGLELAQKNHLTGEICRLLAHLGAAATYQKDYDCANSYYQDATKLARKNRHLPDTCLILNQQGFCYLAQKKLHFASQVFNEAQQIAKNAKLDLLLAESSYGLARIAAPEF